MRPAFGDWRSLVAHFVRDEGVGGSNPLSPTKFKALLNEQGFLHLKPMRMRTSGGRGSTRAKRENVASATARRASHAVASHPLSPTKFKALLNEQGFLHLKPMRMRTSGGRGSTRAKRENVASATARRVSHAVASHPLSPTKFKTLLNEQGFLHLKPMR